MSISGGPREDVVVDNVHNKCTSCIPVGRCAMHCFEKALSDLLEKAALRTTHEVGCREDYLVLYLEPIRLRCERK